MYIVYIIQSRKTKRYYVGYTNDLAKRLKQHNAGKNISTKGGVPWHIIYREKANTKNEAWLREHTIKSYKGGEAFRRLIKD